MKDPIVEELRQLILTRSETGIKKYNTTLDRKDIDLKGWLTHSLEEQLDNCLYILRAIKELEALEQNKNNLPGYV